MSSRGSTRPHADGEPARHVTELSDVAGMEHVRANVWRYEPGAAGPAPPAPDAGRDVRRPRRARCRSTSATRPSAATCRRASLVHVTAGTALQSVNHGAEDLVVYAHGWPPEDEHAELLDPAVS